MTSTLALFQHEPILRERLPWLPLGTFPTPVEAVDLADGGRTRPILVKRDDLCATGYAGNKVRKLEFLLADAQRVGARRLVTAGATGSHHAFATAHHGRALGFAVSLVLMPQTRTPHVRDMLLLDHAAGAELRWVRGVELLPWGLWRARFDHRADRPYVVPPGGSSAVGSLGYVNGGLELAAQIAAGTVAKPSSIHVAAGTLGTVAGMAIGLAWAGVDIPVMATRITPRIVTNERVLGSLVRRTLALLARAGAGATVPLPTSAEVLRLVHLQHDQLGAGYGHATPAGEHAFDTFAAAGLHLDATYTAKCAASLLASAPETDPLPLFWHTLSAVEPPLPDGAEAADLPLAFRRYLER